MARKQDRYAQSAQQQVMVNGHVIRLSVPSDRAVVERVAALIDRKVAKDDWRPHASKEAALQRWAELDGIRAAVLRAKGFI